MEEKGREPITCLALVYVCTMNCGGLENNFVSAA